MLAEAERSYEVYQRQAATDIPVAIPPGFWLRPEFVADPYPTLALLREHYRCFRDWHTNTYWVTSYDEVTSLIADDANFAARPRHATYGAGLFGRDLRNEPLVATRWALACSLWPRASPGGPRMNSAPAAQT